MQVRSYLRRQMRDQIIHGLANAHVRAKLLSYGEALTLQKADEVGRDLEALTKPTQRSEKMTLLGSHFRLRRQHPVRRSGSNVQVGASLAPHLTQHGGGFPPKSGGGIQDGCAGSTRWFKTAFAASMCNSLRPSLSRSMFSLAAS
ncbi:hypothetical protein HPB52_008365 [Rhipicephalus sanguineus]|uniref:Uncharacterized protein n=1 Tax=Rhipicephalus sanguineus TaxID=34632 RepID=A0A9D4T5D0_RHISA|nr:hypothetical protein HPB52_008365 [Rhipicephalus sanguineus]